MRIQLDTHGGQPVNAHADSNDPFSAKVNFPWIFYSFIRIIFMKILIKSNGVTSILNDKAPRRKYFLKFPKQPDIFLLTYLHHQRL